LQKANLTIGDIGLVEINEAFAVQTIAIIKELGINTERVNVNGGAIAIGHPIGASGARVLVTLIYEMIRRNERYGMTTLCIGGGMGIALIIEKVINT
jgi:acetyl-CoA C-acetyltransferase